MNMETVNVWAQLIASIGVIISLFYLAAQGRQNTRSARAIVVDSLARSMPVTEECLRPSASQIMNNSG
jgi:hypothetical protein